MMNKTIKTILVSGFFLCTIPVMAQEEFPDMQPPFPQQEEGKAPFKEIPNPEKSAKRITEEMVYKLILKEQKSLIENRMGQMRPPMMPGNPGEGEMPMMGQPGERPPMGMGPAGMSHPRPPRMDEDMQKSWKKPGRKKKRN